jgi:CDP-diacylglycerol---serine O-phosphatidyltransferase
LEDPNKPAWASAFFTGIPAPAGAGLAMVPLYLGFLNGDTEGHAHTYLIAPLIVLIAILLVSRVPTFSGKTVSRVPRDMVLPILAGAALAIVCLITYPWQTLLVAAIAYVALIPLSVYRYFSYKKVDRKREASEQSTDL